MLVFQVVGHVALPLYRSKIARAVGQESLIHCLGTNRKGEVN